MAGLEVVVRPVIFPNIRPTARQSLPPQDDPTKGFAVIRGNPASSGQISESQSGSASTSSPKEEERTVDKVRVFQKDDTGEVNRDNYVDLEVPTNIKMNVGPARGRENWRFQAPEASETQEVKQRSIRRSQGFED